MKRVYRIGFVLFALIVSFSLVACGNQKLSGERIAEILGTQELPYDYVRAQYGIDVEDLRQVVGAADYVFVCLIKGYDSTIYNDSDFPNTQYVIEVIANIKGELRKNDDLILVKSGGISTKHEKFVLYEYDILPKISECYIVLAYGQPNGDILASGVNSNLLIINKDNYAIDVKYIEITEAFRNEVSSSRQRFKSRYDIHYNG
ncbi:MAG: hypothetical protein LBU04_06970 [Christensenellaceae bacterium]|jgi:hypothetical protein|nr:hypothetical protein [Christensenellaceae bacterium]